MTPASLSIRSAKPEDALAIATVRNDAILGIDTSVYDEAALADWAGAVDARLRELDARPVDLRIVAEFGDRIVGYGELVLAQRVISACFVVPSASGQGVGRALVAALERAARDAGLAEVFLESSSNAEGFYRHLQYEALDRRPRVMISGREMDAVIMRKDLSSP